MIPEEQALQERASQVDSLLTRLETAEESPVRDDAIEAIQALLDLYGEGLARLIGVVGDENPFLLSRCIGDPLVAHLLMLHGLHPVDIETRVIQGLDEVRPYLESHGGNVELLEIVDGIARLELHGTCRGCPASMMTLKLAIEDAVQKTAPDLAGIDAEGVPERGSTGMDTSNSNGQDQSRFDGLWSEIGDRIELNGSARIQVMDIEEASVVVLRVGDTYYAYRNQCSGCGQQLNGATLEGKVLTCANCGLQFDARRAGRCLTARDTYLHPVPLIASDSSVRVATHAV